MAIRLTLIVFFSEIMRQNELGLVGVNFYRCFWRHLVLASEQAQAKKHFSIEQKGFIPQYKLVTSSATQVLSPTILSVGSTSTAAVVAHQSA